jgi:hypothetical protein
LAVRLGDCQAGSDVGELVCILISTEASLADRQPESAEPDAAKTALADALKCWEADKARAEDAEAKLARAEANARMWKDKALAQEDYSGKYFKAESEARALRAMLLKILPWAEMFRDGFSVHECQYPEILPDISDARALADSAQEGDNVRKD